MIRYEDVDAWVEARDRVVQAAMDLVDVWEGRRPSETPADIVSSLTTGSRFITAVHALRSLHADRGLRDPRPPGQQEPDAEPEHGQAVHPGGQP